MEKWSLLITAFTPIILAIINGGIRKKNKKIDDIFETVTSNTKKLDKMENRHLVKLRYTLHHDMKEHIEKESIHIKDFLVLKELFNEYLELGGNGEIEYMFNQVEKLERTGEL